MNTIGCQQVLQFSISGDVVEMIQFERIPKPDIPDADSEVPILEDPTPSAAFVPNAASTLKKHHRKSHHSQVEAFTAQKQEAETNRLIKKQKKSKKSTLADPAGEDVLVAPVSQSIAKPRIALTSH